MTVTLKFSFTLSKHASLIDAGASLWVDTDQDGSIEDESKIEMTLDEAKGLEWTASCPLKGSSSTNTGFVLKFVGDPDATWSLKVESDEAGKGVVYEMKDRPVVKPFRQIMGFCS